MDSKYAILGLSTKGTGSNDEKRLRMLLSHFLVEFMPFDKRNKLSSLRVIGDILRRAPPSLIVMEGTGIVGGISCLVGRFFLGHRYLISSGDAVGPFVNSHSIIAGPFFAIYERLLCRFAEGYIGWTPYLVGRALTFGCKRGVTAPGWVIGGGEGVLGETRERVRQSWGVEPTDIVFGILGAIDWNPRKRYCYGLELIQAIRQVDRTNVKVVVIGEGSGLNELRARAKNDARVILPGRVPIDQVMKQLSGFDVASLPQSLDGVGAFRYTTKISEYQSAGLPIITSRIPAAYDLPLNMVWRLPGSGPWDPIYIAKLAELMRTLQLDTLASETSVGKALSDIFDFDSQMKRVTLFVRDILDELD